MNSHRTIVLNRRKTLELKRCLKRHRPTAQQGNDLVICKVMLEGTAPVKSARIRSSSERDRQRSELACYVPTALSRSPVLFVNRAWRTRLACRYFSALHHSSRSEIGPEIIYAARRFSRDRRETASLTLTFPSRSCRLRKDLDKH